MPFDSDKIAPDKIATGKHKKTPVTKTATGVFIDLAESHCFFATRIPNPTEPISGCTPGFSRLIQIQTSQFALAKFYLAQAVTWEQKF